jgi:hypothetical protein
LFRQNKRISTQDYRDGRKDNSHCKLRDLFIFGVGCSWRGAVAGCGSWRGCVDNGSSCGVVLKLSNRFFGALAGARAGCLAGDPKIPERLCSAPTGADFLGF